MSITNSQFKEMIDWCDSFEDNKKKYQENMNNISLFYINIIPYDCIKSILSMTSDGSTYKNLLLVCKYFYEFLEINGDKWRKRFSNHLLTLLKVWPDYNWDWEKISANINVTLEFILKNPNLPWNWENMAANPNITLDIISKTCLISWDYSYLSLNPNITLEYVLNNINNKWSWINLSQNPAMTLEIIEDNIDLPWDFQYISFNPNVTWEYIKNHPSYYWICLGEQFGVTLDIIDNYHSYFWDLRQFSKNPANSFEFIKEKLYPRCDRIWEKAAVNPNINLKTVLENPDIPWNWHYLSGNPNLTWQEIITYRRKNWDNRILSRNTFGKKFIKKHS